MSALRAVLGTAALMAIGVAAVACGSRIAPESRAEIDARGVDRAQVPTWSEQDLEFFLRGSMSTEVLPARVLTTFRYEYRDLFPGNSYAAFGLQSVDPPVGLSAREVPHLAGQYSYGINCAACHVADIVPSGGGRPVRVLGTTSHFDAEAFLGAVMVAAWRTQDPANMARFLEGWIDAPAVGPVAEKARGQLAAELARQKGAIAAAIADDPSGSKGLADGEFAAIAPEELVLDQARLDAGADLGAMAHSFLKLFHNMRAALHIPDAPPAKLPPASGPGRNDAFGLLSAELFGAVTDYAPVKYGVLWNADRRPWVHWDGNTRSALGRNILAALGLGAPLHGKKGELDLALIERHTFLTQSIRPPKYPWDVDADAAARGKPLYAANCASCHDTPETDTRLHDPSEIGTEPRRAREFDAAHAELFDRFFREVEIRGFSAPAEPPIRSTQKYWAPSLDGVWARAPYLHNGSVRTLDELLTPPRARPKSWRRGTHMYDTVRVGYADEGGYVFDTTAAGNGNAGHEYGTALDPAARRDLLEFLKTK